MIYYGKTLFGNGPKLTAVQFGLATYRCSSELMPFFRLSWTEIGQAALLNFPYSLITTGLAVLFHSLEHTYNPKDLKSDSIVKRLWISAIWPVTPPEIISPIFHQAFDGKARDNDKTLWRKINVLLQGSDWIILQGTMPAN